MNNSDMPANPVKLSHEQFEFSETVHTGLTKREAFAMAAMQGLCANRYSNFNCDENIIELTRRSSDIADALLKELEK